MAFAIGMDYVKAGVQQKRIRNRASSSEREESRPRLNHRLFLTTVFVVLAALIIIQLVAPLPSADVPVEEPLASGADAAAASAEDDIPVAVLQFYAESSPYAETGLAISGGGSGARYK